MLRQVLRRCAVELRPVVECRWMGTKMTERTPGELHTYNINKEGLKFLRNFRGRQPSSVEAAEYVSRFLQYYVELIEDNPVTIGSRNAAAMLNRIGRTEVLAHMGDWWMQPSQVEVLQKVCHLLQQQIFRCTSEELANALWGISFLGPQLMDFPLGREEKIGSLIYEIIDRLMRDVSKLRSVDISVFVEGLARLQFKEVDIIMEAVAYEMKLKVVRLNDADLTRFLWSLAQLQYPSRDGTDKHELLSTLAWECKKRLSFWNGVELARVVWAFGVLQFKSIQHLLAVICSHHVHRTNFKGDAAIKMIWGLEALGHHPGGMILAKLSRSFAMDMTDLLPRDIATGFAALVSLGLPDDRVATRIKELILQNEVEGWSGRDAAVVLWALARSDFLEHDVFMILRRYLLRCNPAELSEQGKRDMYRCHLHFHMFRPSMARLLPPILGTACQSAWIKRQAEQPVSPILSDVLERLEALGFDAQGDVALHEGLIFAHTAAKSPDEQFAVEILHGAKRFMNDNGAVPEGQRWREDVLLGWGWKVLRVDEKRWNRLTDPENKLDYLKLLIQRA